MRKNSPKQTEASRKNGGKGNGPTTPKGKNRVRLNALKDGLFSKDIVIESLGERKEDFERLKKEMWDLYKPASAQEGILVADNVENWWRRQRVRRAESADLKNRLDTWWIRDELRRRDEIESPKALFCDLLGQLLITASSQPPQDTSAIQAKLEEVRQQLAGTSLGVDFLIRQMERVESEAQKGQLSLDGVFATLACCGFGNELGQACAEANLACIKAFGKTSKSPAKSPAKKTESESEEEQILRLALQMHFSTLQMERAATTEAQRAQSDEKEGSSAEQATETGKAGTGEEVPKPDKGICTQLLIGSVRDATRWLRMRKVMLEAAEKQEAKTRSAASIFPVAGSDRFLKAETTIERRMDRALVMLITLRSGGDPSKMLP